MTASVESVFRVPAGIESENVVYSRAFQASEYGCRICGDPVGEPQLVSTPRYTCSKTHRKRAREVRRGERSALATATGAPDTCVYCGATLQPLHQVRSICAKRSCRVAYRRRSFGTFKRRCKWPMPLSWLAKKIKRPADDPTLPQLALGLALKGLLVVYVRGDGTIGEVGKPKKPRVHVPSRDLDDADATSAGRNPR